MKFKKMEEKKSMKLKAGSLKRSMQLTKIFPCQAWWYTPIISAVGRLSQDCEFKTRRLYREHFSKITIITTTTPPHTEQEKQKEETNCQYQE
jgi:hypothetical protein